MNVGSPEDVFSLSFIPNDGVGLARMEFIISNHIKIHPMALLQFDRLSNAEGRAAIQKLTAGYDDDHKPQFFIDTLTESVAMIAAESFAEIFDGFSIGSNDLTQLTLGVDRDSEIVAHIFDERDQAVMSAISSAIASAKKAGRKIGICGQAPSDYPEFAQFLVEQGIDSISLNPDAVMKTTVKILELEQSR